MTDFKAPQPAQAPAQVLQSCLRDFAAIAIEEESELKPTAELVDALIKASTPESPIGRMRDALAAIPAPEGGRPALPPLPPHPDARVFTWTPRELAAIKRYGEACARAALAAQPEPATGNWINSDDVNRLVRELDVALNGEAGAARQASLCDLVAQVKAAKPSPAEGDGATPGDADIEWPDIDDLAHSAAQEAYSYGISHDLFKRWMTSAMFKTASAIRAAMIAKQEAAQSDVQPKGAQADQKSWCLYVAGMVGAYLGFGVDDDRIPAMASVIERRLWALAPSPAVAHEQVRNEALEEAAKLCDIERAKYLQRAGDNDGRESDFAFGSVSSSEHLAAAIRALAGKPPVQGKAWPMEVQPDGSVTPVQPEDLMFNGLTREQTDATASVFGLTAGAEAWRRIEPFLGKDVPDKEVVLLEDVKSLLAKSATAPDGGA